MILYHGSLSVVDSPRILPRTAERGADFGAGFYTTASHTQALRWVRIRQGRQQGQVSGYISSYDAPDDILRLSELKIRRFTGASRAWLEFVRKNRTSMEYDHGFDLVYGPVANDRVYTTLNLWEGGFIDLQETLKRLKTFRLVVQMLFHTPEALEYLHFRKAETIL